MALLFEAEVRGISAAEVVDTRAALAEAKPDIARLHPYTAAVARGVSEHAAHIDDLITAHLRGWTLDRLPAVDRAILRVSVWELLHAADVPEPVVVDEAVQLAKELSTDDSPGRSSSPVETTGTINTAAPTPRFGIEVATATEGDR